MNKDLMLPSNNYYPETTTKNRIVIGNIPFGDLSFFDGWKLRYNGKYKKTCHYTIDQNGVVYNHFPIENYSSFVGVPDIDKESITIGLLNLGWIKHNSDKTRWIDWRGIDIDIDPKELIRKQWREYSYWYPYSDNQITSLIKLLKQVSNKGKVEKLMIDNNTLLINKKEFWPISFRSNYLYYRTDVSPAFPFDKVISSI